MPLASAGEIVAAAGGVGIGAFNVINLEHAEAIVAGAEARRRAGRSCRSARTRALPRRAGADRARPTLAVAGRRRAGRPSTSTTPRTSTWCDEAVDSGFSSVMFDALGAPYDEQRRGDRAGRRGATRRLSARGRARRGRRQGRRARARARAPTRPRPRLRRGDRRGRARRGRRHLARDDGPDGGLDLDLIAALREAVPVPLVLHGSSGVPDDDLAARGRGRHDEDQHRDASQHGLHRCRTRIPFRRPVRRGHPEYLAPGATRSRARSHGCSGRYSPPPNEILGEFGLGSLGPRTPPRLNGSTAPLGLYRGTPAGHGG